MTHYLLSICGNYVALISSLLCVSCAEHVIPFKPLNSHRNSMTPVVGTYYKSISLSTHCNLHNRFPWFAKTFIDLIEGQLRANIFYKAARLFCTGLMKREYD